MTATLYRVFELGSTPGDEHEVDRDAVPNIAAMLTDDHARLPASHGVAFVVRTTNGSLLQLFSRFCRADDYAHTCKGAKAVATIGQHGQPLHVCLYHLNRMAMFAVPVRDRTVSLNPPEVDEFDDAMAAAVDRLIDDVAPDSVNEDDVHDEADTIAQAFGMPLDLTHHRLVEAIQAKHVAVIA